MQVDVAQMNFYVLLRVGITALSVTASPSVQMHLMKHDVHIVSRTSVCNRIESPPPLSESLQINSKEMCGSRSIWCIHCDLPPVRFNVFPLFPDSESWGL